MSNIITHCDLNCLLKNTHTISVTVTENQLLGESHSYYNIL